MKKKTWVTLLVLIVLIAGGLAGKLFFKNGVVEVKIEKAKKKTLSIVISSAGVLEAKNKVNLVAEINGIIKDLPFEDGSLVKEGDIILELDEALLELAKKQAWSTYLAAKANLEKLEGIPTTSETDLNAAKAQVSQAYAAYEIAKENLGKAKLAAPIDGTLIHKPIGLGTTTSEISVGSVAQQGQVLFTIADLSKMNFVANVDETDVGRMEVGQEAEVVIDAYPNEIIGGKVVKIGSVSSVTATGATVFSVEIELKDTTLDLKEGMNGSADIIETSKENILVVPLGAVLEKEEKNVVYVVEDGVVSEQEVEAGLSDEAYVEIKSGLKADEQVVISGADKLKDGDKVRVAG